MKLNLHRERIFAAFIAVILLCHAVVRDTGTLAILFVVLIPVFDAAIRGKSIVNFTGFGWCIVAGLTLAAGAAICFGTGSFEWFAVTALSVFAVCGAALVSNFLIVRK